MAALLSIVLMAAAITAPPASMSFEQFKVNAKAIRFLPPLDGTARELNRALEILSAEFTLGKSQTQQ